MSQAQLPIPLRDALAAARRGDKDLARQLLRQAVQADPASETAWLWLYRLAETPREGLACLLRVREINPANVQVEADLPTAYLQAGIFAAKRKDRRQAYAWLREAVARDPDCEQALLWLASVTDSPEEALSYLQRVLARNPHNARAWQGVEYFNQQIAAAGPAARCPLCLAKLGEAAARCQACGAALSLDNAELFLDNDALRRDILEQAVERIGGLLETAPTHESYYHVGLALVNLGELDEAMPYLHKAQRLKPADAELRQQVATLPARKRQAEEARRLRLEAEARAREAARPRTILVVDDSPTVRKLVSLVLQKANHRVLTAAEPAQAAEIIRAQGVPDLIFLDINMPNMDGYQFCRLLRQDEETAAVPVVMLSGKDGLFSRLRGSWAGSTKYLTKPFEPEALVRVVQECCP